MTTSKLVTTLRAIDRFYDTKGYYPSMGELGKELGKSAQTSHNRVKELEQLSLLKTNEKGRIISIVAPPDKDKEGCPECGGATESQQWTHTVARSDGEPEEQNGTGIYCKNKNCFHHLNPID